MSVDNEKQTRLELEGQNSGESMDGAAAPMGYEDAAGVVRAVPGDDDSAALKTPPFLTDPAVWIPATTVPIAAYAFTSVIDVTKRRLVEVYIEYIADPDDASRLSIVPRIRRSRNADDTDEMYPMGAIDVAPATVTLLPPFDAVGPAAASRSIFLTEFRTTLITAAAVYRNTLGFDVSAYSAFQLGFAEIEGFDASTLRLDYAFSD